MNPVPFNGQDYEKQKGPGNSDQSLFRLQNKFKKIPLLVKYYLTKFDDVIYQAVFELFQILHLLIYASQFMTSQIILLSFVLESVKRKGKNYENLQKSPKQKELFR